jgi:hypothetical protein
MGRSWLLFTSIQNAPFIGGSIKEEILNVLQCIVYIWVAAGARVRFMSRLNGRVVEVLNLGKLLGVVINVRDASAWHGGGLGNVRR